MNRLKWLALFLVLLSGLLVAARPCPQGARNVILLIGDGMGPGVVTAAGMRFGELTQMEQMPVTGLVRTASPTHFPIDSAAGGTALATGRSAPNGTVSVGPDGSPLPTLLERAQAAGRATGLVTSGSLVQSPIASFAAHAASRNMKDEIGAQLLQSRVDLLLGGGRQHFRSLSGWRQVGTLAELGQFSAGRSLGFFERPELGTPAAPGAYPTLAELTSAALRFLAAAPQGFMLVVEQDHIDHAGHRQAGDLAIEQTWDLNGAVGVCRQFAQEHGDTLVVVTADHDTGNLTLLQGDPSQKVVEVSFPVGHHTGNPVPLYAQGPGAMDFTGTCHQTQVPARIARAAGLEW